MLSAFMCLLRVCAVTALVVFVPSVRARAVPDQAANIALRQALEKFDVVQADVGSKIANAAPKVQNEASQVQLIPTSPKAEPQAVTAERRTYLLGKIETFLEHVKSEETLYTRWAVGLVVAAGLLALFGAILSFLRQHIVGGVAGLIVTAILGISNVYPLNGLSDFYRGLEGQVSALQIDCESKQPLTIDSFNSAITQLKLLYAYEDGQKRPSLGNYRVQIATLANDMQSVKSSSEVVEKTRAVAGTM